MENELLDKVLRELAPIPTRSLSYDELFARFPGVSLNPVIEVLEKDGYLTREPAARGVMISGPGIRHIKNGGYVAAAEQKIKDKAMERNSHLSNWIATGVAIFAVLLTIGFECNRRNEVGSTVNTCACDSIAKHQSIKTDSLTVR